MHTAIDDATRLGLRRNPHRRKGHHCRGILASSDPPPLRPRHRHRARDDRQRLALHLHRPRHRLPTPAHPPHSHAPLPTPDQRQGERFIRTLSPAGPKAPSTAQAPNATPHCQARSTGTTPDDPTAPSDTSHPSLASTSCTTSSGPTGSTGVWLIDYASGCRTAIRAAAFRAGWKRRPARASVRRLADAPRLEPAVVSRPTDPAAQARRAKSLAPEQDFPSAAPALHR